MADNPYSVLSSSSAAPAAPQSAPSNPYSVLSSGAPAGGGVATKTPKVQDPGLVRRALAFAQWAARSPVVHSLDTVLNAQTRGVLGAYAGENPFRSITEPGRATEITHAAERKMGLPVFDPSKAETTGLKAVEGLGQTAEDTAVETAASMGMNLLGRGVGALARMGRIPEAVGTVARAARIPQTAARIISHPKVDRLLTEWIEGYGLSHGATRAGSETIKGMEISSRDRLLRQEQQYADLVEKHRPQLQAIDARRQELEARLEALSEKEKANSSGLNPQQRKTLHRLILNEGRADAEELRSLRQGIPAELRTALLQRAYLEGSPQVRRAVIKSGYAPTVEDRKSPILNILHKFRDEYEPTQKIYSADDIAETRGPVYYVKQGGQGRAPFDLPKQGGSPTDPLADRILDRLVTGARRSQQRGTPYEIMSALGIQRESTIQAMRNTVMRIQAAKEKGLPPAQIARYEALLKKQIESSGAAKALREKMLKPESPTKNVQIAEGRGARPDVYPDVPEAVAQRLFGTKEIYQKSLAREFSDLQRDALFILPFAHQKNITILAALGPGGMKTVARGMAYARQLKTAPSELADRVKGLEDIGASQHYFRTVEPAYAQLGKEGSLVRRGGKALASFADRGNAALERYDMGMRLALEDELKGKGVSGFAAGGQIRDVLGDYQNVAPALQGLRNRWGANFPSWRLGIVPRAMTKAIRERPESVRLYARLERLLSDNVSQPTMGADFDAGGPLEDYARLVTPPFGTAGYLTSASTLGPISWLFGLPAAAKSGYLLPYTAETAQRFVPFGSVIGAAANLSYPTQAPLPARVAASAGGAYFQDRPTIKQRRAQLQRFKLKPAEIEAELRREGYIGGADAEPEGGANPYSVLSPTAP